VSIDRPDMRPTAAVQEGPTMPPSVTFDEPPEFDVGDRVITTEPIGPVLRRRVARGTGGIVVARTAERLIAVRFADGTVEHVHPNTLALDTGRPLT
jgi:hypothetical protein